MNQRFLTFLILSVTFFTISCGSQKQQQSDGWVSLFDGKSLDGWQASENKGTFTVKDGTIAVDGDRSHLFYMGPVQNHDFKNFEFELIRYFSITSPVSASEFEKLSENEILLQITPEGSPLRITPSANAKSDPAAETDAAGNNAFKSLIEIGQQMDLAEPLQRIQKALETICQEAGIPSATK